MDDIPEVKAFRSWVDGYIVRIMTPEDAEIVKHWYSATGIVSSCDLDIALGVYPPSPGFYIGEVKGEVVASALRIPWGDVYYGAYDFVSEEHKGKSYGPRLRDQVAFQHVGENVLCMDVIQDKSDANKKLGFVEIFTTGRFQGVAKKSVAGIKYSGKIVSAKAVTLDDIIAYDNKCFIRKGLPIRRAFLEKAMAIRGASTYVALDAKGTVVGFGSRRPCIQEGHHMVGPLYGNSPAIAEALLQKLCHGVEGDNVSINIWYRNEAAVAMVKKFQFNNVFDLDRMHINGKLDEYKKEVFAVTSIEVCGF